MTLTDFDASVSHQRIHGPPVSLSLDAHILFPGGVEQRGRMVAASTGEVALATAFTPRFGDRVIIYVREFGRLEGNVDRETESGFAITLDLPEDRRRRLANQLVWFANRDSCGMSDARRHERFVPRMPWTAVRTSDGRTRFARINDISVAGVSVDTDARVRVGDRVAFGVKVAVVGRVFDGGFAAQFEEPFAEGELSESLRL